MKQVYQRFLIGVRWLVHPQTFDCGVMRTLWTSVTTRRITCYHARRVKSLKLTSRLGRDNVCELLKFWHQNMYSSSWLWVIVSGIVSDFIWYISDKNITEQNYQNTQWYIKSYIKAPLQLIENVNGNNKSTKVIHFFPRLWNLCPSWGVKMLFCSITR